MLTAILVGGACAGFALTGTEEGGDGQVTFTSRLETSSVAVDVDQYQIDRNGQLVPAKTGTVVPGQTVSYIPRISNLSQPGYVRAKVDLRMQGEECQVSLNDIEGLNEKWIEQGGYLYCTQIMDETESADIFTGLHVPEEVTINDAHETDNKLTVTVTVQAIQARNFTPDFGDETPWTPAGMETAGLEYTGSGRLEASKGSLFAEAGSLVPGDRMDQNLTVTNSSADTLVLSFGVNRQGATASTGRLSVVAGSCEDLLSEIRLQITDGGKTVYEGMLADAAGETRLDLPDIGSGQQKNLKLSLSMPAETGNSFAELKDSVEWIFVAEAKASGGNKNTKNPDGNAVRTDDEAGRFIVPAAVICIIMSVVIMAVTRRRKT